jgi:hypothetical protein
VNRCAAESMKIRLIALSAICIPVCLNAGDLAGAPLAIYYGFDAPPSAAVVTEMQVEMDRIFADGGLRLAWRALGAPRRGEDFPGIVVFQFRGICSFDHFPVAIELQPQPVGQPLAKTDVTNGQVLPFGAVDCDRLRIFIAPALKSLSPEEMNAGLGRAIARVAAHEIYHMLTESEGHARHGIARASHTRAELTAPTFVFAPKETQWLRSWEVSATSRPVVEAVRLLADAPETDSPVPEPVSVGGR